MRGRGARLGGGRFLGNWGCIKTSLDEGHDHAPNSSLGAGLGTKVALTFLCLTNVSALQKEEVREFLKEKWFHWRDIFCEQRIEKIR